MFEKNYRLQDIQLSKSPAIAFRLRRAELPRQLVNLFVQPQARQRLLGRETAFSRFARHGGEYRARTGDLLVANQALSQLS